MPPRHHLFVRAQDVHAASLGAHLLAMTCAIILLNACHNTRTTSAGRGTLVGHPPQRSDTQRASSSFDADHSQGEGPVREGMLWYRIAHDEDTLHVTMRLLRPPETLSLFLPGPWAGERSWERHLRIREARTPEGAHAVTFQRTLGRLDLDLKGEPAPSWVELDYDVALSERTEPLDRFSPHREGEGFFIYAPTLFVLPSERLATSMREIPVELLIDEGHEPVSTWSRSHHAPSSRDVTRRVHGFVLSDVRALRDAFLFVSAEAITQRPSASLEIAYDARFEGDMDAFSSFIDETLTLYRTELGSSGEQTTAVVRSPPKSGSPAQRWGTGRRNGFVLELEHDATLDQGAKLLIAHEALHMWNGHILVPHAESEAKTRWFKEGLTHYMALKTLLEQGHLSERAFLDEIAQSATRYEGAHDTAPDDARARQQMPLYPYDKGVLLALHADHALSTSRADDPTTLSSWLNVLLDYARSHPSWRYTQEDLFASLASLRDQESASHRTWKAHCDEDSKLDVSAFFERLGLHWLAEGSGRSSKLIPFKRGDQSWKAILRRDLAQ